MGRHGFGPGSGQPRPGSLAVADQHPVASRADLRPIGLQAGQYAHRILQVGTADLCTSGAQAARSSGVPCGIGSGGNGRGGSGDCARAGVTHTARTAVSNATFRTSLAFR